MVSVLTLRRTPRRRVGVAATLVSIESVVALALAHLAAGGALPSAWWLAAFGAPVYGASRLVLRRRASIRVVLPVLVAMQVLGHAWLVALATSGAVHDGHAGHLHESGPFLGLSPAMLAGHLAAAAVTGAMWALRRRAVDVLLQWAEPARVPVVPRVRRGAHGVVAGLVSQSHLTAWSSRGPPLGASAIA